MGRSLDAFIAFGCALDEPEWVETDEYSDEPTGYSWPWDKPGEWWSEDSEAWLLHLYGYVPDEEEPKYSTMHEFEEENVPFSIEYVSWGDEGVRVLVLKASKTRTGWDEGHLSFDPADLLDERDIGYHKDAWGKKIEEFEKKSGFKINPSWFVGYSFG
jgi:hypothetical protein